jgi:hypothetical protein
VHGEVIPVQPDDWAVGGVSGQNSRRAFARDASGGAPG